MNKVRAFLIGGEQNDEMRRIRRRRIMEERVRFINCISDSILSFFLIFQFIIKNKN